MKRSYPGHGNQLWQGGLRWPVRRNSRERRPSSPAVPAASASCSEQLAEAGAHVFVNGRSGERGERAQARLREISPDARIIAGDCASYQDAAAVVDAARSAAGRLDILISAGAEGETGPTPFAEMTPQQIEGEFRKRLFPRIFPVHAALPALRENGGSIVLLTTNAGQFATPGESVLGAVGASVIMMTKALGKEFSRYKIRVDGIALALTSGTPTWDRLFAGESSSGTCSPRWWTASRSVGPRPRTRRPRWPSSWPPTPPRR